MICAFGVLDWYSVFGIDNSLYEVSTNTDRTMKVNDARELDSNTGLYAYDFGAAGLLCATVLTAVPYSSVALISSTYNPLNE
jgi:hypothetical protein